MSAFITGRPEAGQIPTTCHSHIRETNARWFLGSEKIVPGSARAGGAVGQCATRSDRRVWGAGSGKSSARAARPVEPAMRTMYWPGVMAQPSRAQVRSARCFAYLGKRL